MLQRPSWAERDHHSGHQRLRSFRHVCDNHFDVRRVTRLRGHSQVSLQGLHRLGPMNRPVLALVTILLLAGLAIALLRDTRSAAEQPSGPIERVAIGATDQWLNRLTHGGETVFRRDPIPDTPGTSELHVVTLGRLPRYLELQTELTFRNESASHASAAARLQEATPATTKSMLEAAEAMVMAERMKIAGRLMNEGSYVTVEVDSCLPPEVPTHDRIVHGNISLGPNSMKVVVYVPRNEPRYAESVGWARSLYDTFWNEYCDEFNRHPYEERCRRILEHDVATKKIRSLEREGGGKVVDQRTADEPRGRQIDWRVEIERQTCTLSPKH